MKRFLDALVEPGFERMPDGRLICFAWFGRGYEISERTYQALRRELRWWIALVYFGYPLVACFAVERVGVLRLMAFIALSALAANLRIAWLMRGARRTAQRRSARASRERTAAALSYRAICGITLPFLAPPPPSLWIAVVEEEPVFIATAVLAVAVAAWIGGGLFRLKRRVEERDR